VVPAAKNIPTINREDKAAVAAAYHNYYLPALAVPMGWTGSASSCTPGTISANAQAATFDMINYLRRMAGLEQVTENTAASSAAQRAALMFKANNAISHTPPTSWLCYNANGARIAGISNISYARGYPSGVMAGADAVAAYVTDYGVESLGHRRPILSPGYKTMGSGSTDNSNALVIGSTASDWDTKQDAAFTNTFSHSWSSPQLQAWPAAGYFPYEMTYDNHGTGQIVWSLATGSSSISFANATVAITKNGSTVSGLALVPEVKSTRAYGDLAAIGVRIPAGVVSRPAGGQTDTYHVTVAGITGYGTYQYDVKVFSAAEATASSVTIAGTAQVGQVLTATANGVTPSDAALAYQWLRDGSQAVGANSKTYTLVAADAGHTISVRVTPSKSGFTSVPVVSSPTATVVTPPPAALTVPKPVITGSGQVGQAMSVAQVITTPAGGTVTYAWLVGGVQVKSGTSASVRTYTPVAADVGKQIVVTATATLIGFTTAQAQSDPKTVLAGTLTVTKPVLSGSAEVGKEVTVAEVTTTPAGGTVTYAWLVGGVQVKSGTSASVRTYTPVAADVGKSVVVKVTATMAGYTTASDQSAAKTVASGYLEVSTPVIGGVVQVGQQITVGAVTTSPADATVVYAWLTGGTQTKSGTGDSARSITPAAADAGKTLVLRVTASAPGYATTVVSSNQVIISAGTLTVAKPVLSGLAEVGKELTVAQVATTPAGGTVTYAWLVGGVEVKSGTDAAARSYKPVAADANKSVLVQVTAALTGYGVASNQSDTASIVAGSLDIGKPVLVGDARVGQELTVAAVTTDPAGGAVTYTWLVGGVEVKSGTDAAARSYKPVGADVDKPVLVRVTGSFVGYKAASNQSDPKTVEPGQIALGALVTSGQPVTGEPITIQPIITDPPGAQVVYKWFVGERVVASGTDVASLSYTPDGADAGLLTYIELTVSLDGYQTVVIREDLGYVTPGVSLPLLSIDQPVIQGVAQVGKLLTVDAVAAKPADAAVTYAWFVGGAAAKTGRDDAARSYTPVASEAGQEIYVRAVASLPSGATVEADSAAAVIAKGTLSVGKPGVTGVAQVGQALTAAVVATTPTGGTVTYVWTVDGKEVKSGTDTAARSYTPVPADAGKVLIVKVTASLSGYEIATQQSDSRVVANGTLSVGKPVVTGLAQVGQALTVAAVATTPAGGTVTYTWSVGGVEVKSGTQGDALSYTPTVDDAAKTVQVTVTATLAGYEAAANQSDPVIITGLGLSVTKPVITGTAKVGQTLRVATPVTTNPAGGLVVYMWVVNGRTVRQGIGSLGMSYTLGSADAGKSVYVQVSGMLAGYPAATNQSDVKTVAAR
jgi:uncharacterized protein YkwD